jgi:hypothetical protein
VVADALFVQVDADHIIAKSVQFRGHGKAEVAKTDHTDSSFLIGHSNTLNQRETCLWLI